MKKILLALVGIFIMMNQCVFAGEYEEYIEYSSGEQDDGAIYLDTYEDYINALQGVDEQEKLKQEYYNMMAETITSYDMSERTEVVKAKVLSVDATTDYYSYDGYGLYKILYQPINIEVLEGEHKGEKFDVSYILTADSYENIKTAPIKVNQKINVVFQENEGEIYAYATTIDSAVNRVGYTIFILFITLIFMIIFLGKRTLKLLPGAILLADMIFLVFVPELFVGRSILWLTIVTSVLYLMVDTSVKVGINSKMVSAILSSISVTVVMTIALVLFGNIVNFSGITYDITNIIEAFPKGTIDFYMLYISSFILMSIILTSDIACRAININSEEKTDVAKSKIREYVVSKLSIIVGILLVIMIPKYLNTLVIKYTFRELINSEMLTTDIVRILMLIISSVITTQMVEIFNKLFVDENVKKKAK